jgi:hypothetical protein
MDEPGSEIMIAVACIVGVTIVWRALQKIPIRPDAWEPEISRENVNSLQSAVCVTCLEPVVSPRQHYCPKCGGITGELTGYIPFVNIQFECSIFDTLWKRLLSEGSSWRTACAAFAVLGVLQPFLLFIAVPAFICHQRRQPDEARVPARAALPKYLKGGIPANYPFRAGSLTTGGCGDTPQPMRRDKVARREPGARVLSTRVRGTSQKALMGTYSQSERRGETAGRRQTNVRRHRKGSPCQ